MPVTISVYKVEEKKPEHGQNIIWLQNESIFGRQGVNPRATVVEYEWTEYFLADNSKTGSVVFYNQRDEQPNQENGVFYGFSITADGWELKPNDLWIDVEDCWKCLDASSDA